MPESDRWVLLGAAPALGQAMAKRRRLDDGPANDNVHAPAIDRLIARAMGQGAVLKDLANTEASARWDAEEARYKPAGTFAPGDRVVLTAKSLQQMHGGERLIAGAATKVWTVVECRCDLCASNDRMVAVDELVSYEDEFFEAVMLPRHLVRDALRHHGQPTVDELPANVTDADMTAIGLGLRRAQRRQS